MILIGLIVVLLLALTGFLSYLMARRQQEALKLERKAVPSRGLIFAAGIVTVLAYLGAIVAAILMLAAPFINLNLTGTVDGTTNLLITLVIVLAIVGTGLYWIFVKLGLFSWKSLSLD
jgi:hypothetical protein